MWGDRIPFRTDAGSENYLRMTETGACPYLGDDEKCWLQKNFGHETLPFICRTYPRRYVSTPLGTFATLAVSCHTAARFLSEDPRESPIDPGMTLPVGGALEAFRLEEGVPLTLAQARRIESAWEKIFFAPRGSTAERLVRASAFLDAVAPPLSASDDLGFTRAAKSFLAAPSAVVEPRPVSEQISILRAILRQRRNFLVTGESASTFPEFYRILEEAYGMEKENARPPASIRMSRAIERHWKPGLAKIDPILLRYVQREIWSKQYTYAHGYRDGFRIVVFLYFLLRAAAAARATRDGVPVGEAHVLAAVTSVARDFAHSKVVLSFWKDLLRIPHASKPWFVPLLVLC